MKILKLLTPLLLICTLFLSGCDGFIDKQQEKTVTKNSPYQTSIKQKPYPYSNKKIVHFEKLDQQDRPQDAHIQIKYSDKPKSDREPRLNFNPPGWHNYRIKYKKDNGQISKYWTFDRTHLVGYLFSGVNTEPKNLVMGTTHLNRGSYSGMDESNKNSMLYYEMNLDHWLKENPDNKIDYQVTPLYKNDELVPRQIRLAYTGYDIHGKHIPIKFGAKQEQKGHHATVVILDNKAPNLHINYKNGTAYPVCKVK